MDRIHKFPNEFAETLLPSLSYLNVCNIICRNSNANFWEKYRRFLFIVPAYLLHVISATTYIFKLFTAGLDPFEEPDSIPAWLVDIQVLNKCTKLVSWQYLLLPLIETLIRTFVLAQKAELQLPFACIYPFAIDNWPVYLGVYAFQVYTMFLTVYMYLGTNLLLVTLTTFLRIQFILLQEDLVNITPTNNGKRVKLVHEYQITEFRERSKLTIEDFVRRHQDVILLTKQLNAVFNKIIFVTLVCSTLVICFFAVAAKASVGVAHMLNNCGAIFIMMTSILLMCYCSELLSASSVGIAHSAAKSMWYKGDLRHQTIICFIILRSQKPCNLMSLNFSSISMRTFNKVLKTTYSYFSLASQMYDARD